jgi:benzodiazapine receptor
MRMKLFLSLAITLAVGFIAGFATSTSIGTWYATLRKPGFTPPNWLFPVVWTTLYILMGIALNLVWRQPRSNSRSRAVAAYFVQLTLNFLWSFIFFQWHAIGWAFVDIICLWSFIAITIILFYVKSKTATVLMVPYLLWVSYATALNYFIWELNR